MFFAVCLIAAATNLNASTGPELVTNGGFESGDFTGWTVTHAATGSNIGVTNIAPHSGTFDAFFHSTSFGVFDSISQSIPTIPGALYEVRFSLRNDTSSSGEFLPSFGNNTLDDFGSSIFPYT